jgi:hypothetical protein
VVEIHRDQVKSSSPVLKSAAAPGLARSTARREAKLSATAPPKTPSLPTSGAPMTSG